MSKVTFFLIALVALLGFLLLSVDKENSSRPWDMPTLSDNRPIPTVDVSASESRKYEANEFVTVARLELHGKDKELLFKQLTSRRNSIFEQMKNLEVSESNIEQNSVEMRKEWSYDRGTRSLTGYVVCQSFAIKTSSRSTAAAVIASLSAELDVEISHTSATLKNQDSLKKEAISAVGKKALEKAKGYAESVGGKLGRVISVAGDNYGEAGVVYGRTVLGARKTVAFDEAMGADVSSVADSVEISASIHLVVELLQ
jgi:hypothetical protein